MRFGIATKRMHIVVTYREADEPDVDEVIVGEGGSFDIAPQAASIEGDDANEMHFGFARG